MQPLETNSGAPTSLGIRRSKERGFADHGWLRSHHTFSFADYYDPSHMGFRTLRVINEDRVAPGGGFPTHGHRDMEIVSVVLAGGLVHQDSAGNGSVIRPGDVQRMTAGRGIRHSEFNASGTEPVHFLQIWIVPRARGAQPGYAQRHFDPEERRDALRLVVSPDGRDASLTIDQDANIFLGSLSGTRPLEHWLAPGRHAWLHVVSGAVRVGGARLESGDAIALSGPGRLSLVSDAPAELVLFDLT